MPKIHPPMARPVLPLLSILAALAAVAYLGPLLVTHVTPQDLGTLKAWIDAIWWPATALRLLACAVLAGWVYPRWVLAQARETLAALAEPPPADDLQARAARDARAARAQRLRCAARRGPWMVFSGLLAGELVTAQFPYWLLRG